MPLILRRLLGFVLLVATVGLVTCQSMVKAQPVKAGISADRLNKSVDAV
ncbi:MAG: hypothetical protein ACPW60_00985 [Methylohalobius sp. ZOD2]